MNPLYPVYIPSKSRAEAATTPRVLDRLGVPYRIVVEAQQHAAYREFFPASKLLTLDPSYQASYDALGDFEGKPLGSGPARNFIWDHAISEGAGRHWIIDDNIQYFARWHQNERIPIGDGTGFRAMEDFCERYLNVAMAGPQYVMFAKARDKLPPFILNTRIYSCILIKNDIPFRWRGRYNEDVDLSLRVLKAGWCTVQFYAFLQNKANTQTFLGGNTEAFYSAEGTLPKSQMLVRAHPDVARVTWKFGRWHHQVDYGPFRGNRLVRRPGWEPPAVNPYAFRRVTTQESAYVGKRSPRRRPGA
jgi:hypothetical protein